MCSVEQFRGPSALPHLQADEMAAMACASALVACSAPAASDSPCERTAKSADVVRHSIVNVKFAGCHRGRDTESRHSRKFQPPKAVHHHDESRELCSPATTALQCGSNAAKLGLVGMLAAALMAGGTPASSALAGEDSAAAAAAAGFKTYFGTAASASSYGGYGGNSSKKDSAEYTFEVPQAWKERQISKVEKGTNGTDSEFYNPRRRDEKVYLTFLSGFRKLAPRESVLNNLALSDVNLQDIISLAADIKAADRQADDGQLYYDFEIDSPVAHGLISVTCAKNKLYAHFVKAPASDWAKDESVLRHIHESFRTI